ncbi:glycosyltransferase [Streptomyces sp. NPDC086777]|uniref:glycosyltransferase n=1 Tax=Streptomyces sp. NPDC086777 TaxID=3154866 RepID=UPI00344C951A
MRVLFFSTPLRRRLLPMLPLARELSRQGHEVAFATAGEAARWLEPEGFEVMSLGPGPHELTAEVARRLGADILLSSDRELTVELFAGARVDLMADEAVDRARGWAPDLVVCEDRDFVGPLVASMLGVLCAVAVTGPAPEPEELDALVAAVRPRYVDRGLRPPSRVPAGHRLLDLCPPSLQREGWQHPPDRIALRPEPTLRPAGSPLKHPRAATGRPLVLVGFGAEAETSPELGPVVGSLSTLPVDLAVVAGDRRAEDLGVEPGRIRLCSGFPADDDWEAVRAVVHDGGPEITLAAVARGVPALVVAESPEQRERAARLASAGAGIVFPARTADPAMIASGVEQLLSEPRFAVAAARIRDDIVVMPSAAEVARQLVAWAHGERERRARTSGVDRAS